MNDIEILEEFIKYFEAEATQIKYRRNISITVGEDDIEAIENLIQRNKNLEQIEKEHKEENGRLREELDKKENTIDLMAEQLTTPVHSKKWVIDHFINKYEEGKG